MITIGLIIDIESLRRGHGMTQRLHIHGLDVAKSLAELIALDIAPGTGIEPDQFWKGLATALQELAPRNRALLQRRDELQRLIDSYYAKRRDAGEDLADVDALEHFLKEIGYLEPETTATVVTENVDAEIALVAGPQLVVPVLNARYALNAANARWGSLYDALYGSDVISELHGAEKGSSYNPIRGQKVVEYVAAQLNEILPLKSGKHEDVVAYSIDETQGVKLIIKLADGSTTAFADKNAFVGHHQEQVILCRHHGLHLELHIDPQSPIGQHHPAGLKDVVMEAALTTIQDCEDSVAAVDADDKVEVYRQWLGLMQGNLSDRFEKSGKIIERQLASDRYYVDVNGDTLKLSGRSLMLVRNVGHLMTTDAVMLDGQPIPEGILDAFMTSFAAVHDVKNLGRYQNSKTGSVYIVKPKMHGPEEVEFTVDLFAAVEETLGLPHATLKIGIMDEERRTTLNLGACIAKAQDRLIFINTGFLDRTGDEIHTSMEAGPMVRKNEMKAQPWIQAYEQWNVDQGLAAGLKGRAQIGKGMWAKPDLMADMLATKAEHPKSGANCAWVPSPTAAVLHALHYHQVNVSDVQESLQSRQSQELKTLLQVPLALDHSWSTPEIRQEIENNAQGILGYVTRWIQFGIGCSKVPDINDIGLMEDRATLRISAQHIANWLHHRVCTQDDVMDIMKRMAVVVDRQNAGDVHYQPMAPDFEKSIPFQASCDLVFKGREQPNGYTEPLLHHYRRLFKSQQ
tara:strand:+ start:15113 stop:17338 length:2226 start_codon:yes stop_codon:yes gene_type:complete